MTRLFPFLLALTFLFCSISSNAQLLRGQDSFKEKLALATQYYENQEYEKALEYLEDLQKKYTLGAVYEMSLYSYIELKDFKKAEKLIKRFISKINGNNGTYYADLVFLNLLQNKREKADAAVERAFKKVTKNPGLCNSFATAFQKRGYPQIALDIYEIAEAKLPKSNFSYQKALLYGELGDIKKMYVTYVDMLEQTPSYATTIKQLLARSLGQEATTENSDYLKEELIKRIQKGGPKRMNDLLVFVFIQEKNFKGAFTQLKALERRGDADKAEIFNLGRVALNSEDFIMAEKIFAHLTKREKENPFYEEALLGRLKAKKRQLDKEGSTDTREWGDLADSYLEAKKKLIGQPLLGGMSIEMAHILAFKLELADSAENVLKKLISTGYVLLDDKAKAKVKLGDILLYGGNRWDAIIYYGQAEKAFERSPIGQEAKFKRAKAAYFVGDFQWAQGIFDVLKASTSKLIANDAMRYSLLLTDNIALDTNMEAMKLFAQADFLNYQGKWDSSLVTLSLLQKNYPDHALQDEVLYLKAQIKTDKGQFAEAALDWEQLIQLYGKDILADDALYYLANLYEKQLGDPEKAKELYQELFTEHTDSFFTSDARKRFRELRGDILN